MRRLLPALLRIGADPADDESQRLRKALMLGAILMILPAAAVWGALYWFFGERVAALAPWTYLPLTGLSLIAFAWTRSYPLLAIWQFAMYITLPFALMWALGGVVRGSAVALWSWVAPLAARMLGHRRAAVALFLAFAVAFAVSAFAQPMLDVGNQLPDAVVIAFFVLNVVAVGAITLTLLDASSGGREGTLAAMHSVVHRYFSPDVAQAILADPRRQELGGETADVTIMFADLGGYTTYARDRDPSEVVELLNALFGTAVPQILAEGGTPVQMPGDAVMAVFGAPRPAADHAQRAARAALAIQEGSLDLSREHPSWPRFRIGLNSGPALVGNIGSDEFRSFTAIGDTTNMAQRFEALAEPGQVVVGPSTAALLRGAYVLASLGEVLVKGISDPVEPWALLPDAGSAHTTSRRPVLVLGWDR